MYIFCFMKYIAGKYIPTAVEDLHQEAAANPSRSIENFFQHISSPIAMDFANIEDQTHATNKYI